MTYLDSLEIKGRGDCKVLATLDDDFQSADMVTVLWVDNKCRYLARNSEGTDQVGPMYRNCCNQVSEELNSEPDRVELEIP